MIGPVYPEARPYVIVGMDSSADIRVDKHGAVAILHNPQEGRVAPLQPENRQHGADIRFLLLGRFLEQQILSIQQFSLVGLQVRFAVIQLDQRARTAGNQHVSLFAGAGGAEVGQQPEVRHLHDLCIVLDASLWDFHHQVVAVQAVFQPQRHRIIRFFCDIHLIVLFIPVHILQGIADIREHLLNDFHHEIRRNLFSWRIKLQRSRRHKIVNRAFLQDRKDF